MNKCLTSLHTHTVDRSLCACSQSITFSHHLTNSFSFTLTHLSTQPSLSFTSRIHHPFACQKGRFLAHRLTVCYYCSVEFTQRVFGSFSCRLEAPKFRTLSYQTLMYFFQKHRTSLVLDRHHSISLNYKIFRKLGLEKMSSKTCLKIISFYAFVFTAIYNIELGEVINALY